MPITDTPLRYPGGKTQLTPFVVELLRSNNLLQSVYCEPFAGGAGIACRLLLNGTIAEAWINDIDPAIHAFWHSVLNSTDALCQRISGTLVDIAEWHRQREVYADKTADTLDLGFATLFLNRTNRSGILKGGVIGGVNQTGKYLIDCRFGRAELIRKIRRIALYKEQIYLTCIDAREYIASELKKLPEHALVNVDPPYYRAGPDLYTNAYNHDDHLSLAAEVRKMPHRWMMTYDDAPEISAMYDGLRQYHKTLTYYAQVKRSASELLILSDGLIAPPALLEAQAKAA
ncbi:DNA adenine methylase [Pseudothauera nasutitermitis]|uniref:site-specific DNA-methyltransferase (adenine-specific) n=1 Tax=Pseudothauera nasutitermitis TaxID=2565930 RepID=A0A4S4B3Y3_9RHOO|nr:DNA adenine methylase [Pseudothauera nasutitermitis]THF65614.1 DNA adenine methylase [Pseudothauera nasutitermitis]